MAGKPRGRGSAFSDDVMDDEDDRQLLDILGDVDALNDYLHGSNSKSIGEDDVTNAAYGSDASFFSTDTPVSNSGLKDVPDFDATLQPLSGSLSFIEDQLGSPQSPAGATTSPSTSCRTAPWAWLHLPDSSSRECRRYRTARLRTYRCWALSGRPEGVVTLSNLERTPQIVLRPPLATSGQQVLAPTQAQVGGFKNIPLQNIIIQRGPGGTQALVRPIQPKPLQTGAQTVYSLQPATSANVANANGPIVVQSSLEQANNIATPGQFILPGSLALAPTASIQNGPTDANANNAVQIVAGQSFTATAGGQLILNQVGGVSSATPTPAVAPVPAAAAATPAPGRITLVAGQNHVPGSPVQRLLVTQTANCTSLSPLPTAVTQEQSSASPALKLTPIHATQTITVDSTLNSQVGLQRPVPLTRGGMVLQQGALPSSEFSQVDEEFELVASQVVNKTEAMVDKYRKLLMVEAERFSPSSEIVMIDRTFNQEERGGLTRTSATFCWTQTVSWRTSAAASDPACSLHLRLLLLFLLLLLLLLPPRSPAEISPLSRTLLSLRTPLPSLSGQTRCSLRTPTREARRRRKRTGRERTQTPQKRPQAHLSQVVSGAEDTTSPPPPRPIRTSTRKTKRTLRWRRPSTAS
ncbi:hypothetical protein WMY93_013968 [Mugilogobius chulae]|uniref:GLTSCR protein conserved domain-containing protein n=1 Tax=Mugilogobius chulae TaxID=88201 RepID=A0AAW0PAN3_9GOBI